MQKAERIIYLILIIILISVLASTCGTVAKLSLDYNKLANRELDLKVQHQADSSKLYSMALNEVSYKAMIDDANSKIMALEVLKLRKPKEIVNVVYKTKFETSIPLDSPIKFDSTLYLKLPQPFSKTDKWFSLNGKIDLKGTLVIDSLTSFGTLTYGVGDTLRNGLFNRIFRKKDQVVRLHIDNPTMEITNLSNIYVRNDKKWYQTTGFKMLAGAAIGVALTQVVK
jgi:hypothetical protein